MALLNVIIGSIIELLGAIIMVYNIAQGVGMGTFLADDWIWALLGAVIMLGGMILLYSAFRPVIM